MFNVELMEDTVGEILSKDDFFINDFTFITPGGSEIYVNFNFIAAKLYADDFGAHLILHCDEPVICAGDSAEYVDSPYNIAMLKTCILAEIFNEVYLNSVEEPFTFDVRNESWSGHE